MTDRIYFYVIAASVVLLGTFAIVASNIPAAILAAAILWVWGVGQRDLNR